MTTHQSHQPHRPNLLAFGAAVAIGTTFVIITVQHMMLATSRQPKGTPMDMIGRARQNYLRSHPQHDFMPANDLLQGPDGFFSTDAAAKRGKDDFFPSGLASWHDEFFSPFMESPFLKEFQRQHNQMTMEPAFKMDENGDQVSLVMSIPDIPLKDIDIEVIGGRVVHIRGEKTTGSSHVSFDKRFSIGQHLNETNLKAKLTKDGDLVVTAPKVGTGEKDAVRKIPVQEEL